MFETPVLFIIFNRPDVTFRVFDRIRQIRPRYLFIAADGPRKDRANEEELCRQTRSIVNRVDWECELKTLLRSENAGCGIGVSEAITWFFSHVGKGIILEDDCLPDLSFFDYCEQLLQYYDQEERIMHIGGTNSQFGKKRNKYSYYFSKYPHIWGWATWKRAWDHFRFDLSAIDTANIAEKVFADYTFSAEEKKYWLNSFNTMKNKGIDTWDIQWTFACWSNNGATIVPNVNMISNLGFADNATHTRSEVSLLANLHTDSMPIIIHPPTIQIDVKADDLTFRKYNLSQPSFYAMVRNRISQLVPGFMKAQIKKYLKDTH